MITLWTCCQSLRVASPSGRWKRRSDIAAGDPSLLRTSTLFWHQGDFGSGEEWRLVLKIRTDRYDEVEAHLLKHHPWQNPEVSAVPIVAGADAYLHWLETTTARD